jgi:geranylgeranyl pyrophosphate synthase
MSQARSIERSDTALRSFVTGFMQETLDTLGIADPLQRRYWENSLFAPALDILRRPGKEFRSQILESSWQMAGGHTGGHPMELSFLVELLHMGSLIIDDIEDDSAMRRGQPALHRRYGVPVALNTGNWMYFLPLSMLPRLGFPDNMTLAMFKDVSDAVVLSHKGQALDLATHVSSVRQSDMPRVVANSTRLKTGALMRLAALLGARAARAEEERVALLGRMGADIGLGLQMLDDWSGIHAPARLHKGIEDVRHGRLTWPWAWLAEISDEVTFAALLHDASNVSIDWEAEQVILRMRTRLQDHVPQRLQHYFDTLFEELATKLPASAALDELRQAVGVLEKAYG